MGQTAEELKQEVAEKRAGLSRDLESIGDRVSPERIVERRKAAVGQRVESVKHRLMGASDHARDATRRQAHDASASLGETAHGAGERIQDLAEGSPLAMGLIAFGVGLVAAVAVPSSRAETELARRAEPSLQRAAAETGSTARELVDEAKPMLQEAAETVKQSATESAETIRDDVRAAAPKE